MVVAEFSNKKPSTKATKIDIPMAKLHQGSLKGDDLKDIWLGVWQEVSIQRFS